jgi:hypothetical protein
MMSEDVGGYAPHLLAYVRENPQEGLWIAVCMHYEPVEETSASLFQIP